MTIPTPSEAFRWGCRTRLFPYVHRVFLELRPGISFHEGYHVRAICDGLERVERGDITRLLILMPPRHLKSHCVSVVFSASALGRDPSRRIICASYGADLAETFSRDTRRLIQTPWNRAIFPALSLDRRKTSESELRTSANGMRVATSIGGPLTGKGGDILILDDLLKAEDARSEAKRDAAWDWYKGTAVTRLDDPRKGAIICVAQRLHEDDPPGRLMQTGTCAVLELPAIETRSREIELGDGLVWTRPPGDVLLPDHMDLEQLERIRREIGTADFEAQYQQSPTPAGGRIIRPEWFRIYDGSRKRSQYEAVLQSWDPAAVPGESNDYSVCTTWGLIGNEIDLLDVHREQYLYPELRTAAKKLRQKWKPDLIVVEAVGVGQSLFTELHRPGELGVRSSYPRGSKVERMVAQSAKLEDAQIGLPAYATWREAFIAECAAFPNGKYGDQVDCMSQALKAIDRNIYELRHCSRYKGK